MPPLRNGIGLAVSTVWKFLLRLDRWPARAPDRPTRPAPVSIARFPRMLLPDEWLDFQEVAAERDRLAATIDRQGSPPGTPFAQVPVLTWHAVAGRAEPEAAGPPAILTARPPAR